MNGKFLKVFGMAAAVIGFGATLLSDWVNEQEMKAEVRDEVARVISEKNKEES